MVKGLKSHVTGAIWDVDLAALPAWAGAPVRLVRILYAVVRDLGDGMLSLRAMSLVYATLLSLVPLLAISFSVLKGLGVHYDQLEPRLLDFLAPLGEKGVEITEYIIAFVERVEVGVLGAVGLGFLVYTVVSLMQKIERSFNDTWQVTRHRPFARRFSGYLIVLLIGPVLVFLSMGITAWVMGSDAVAALTAIQPLGALVELAGKLVPYLLIIAAFTFIYVFLPNTRVGVRSALVGAAVAGFLWETAGWAFASFILGSTKYTVVYSAFASLILFMIWLYLSWLILLVGASIAFYHQHPEFLTVRRGELRMSNRLREKLALLAVFHIGRSYYQDLPPWTAAGLAQSLHVPAEAAESVLGALEHAAVVRRTGDDPPAYLPARPLETTGVKEVLDAVRAADESTHLDIGKLPAEPAVEALIGDLERGLAGVLEGMTLKDLAVSAEAAGGAAVERLPGKAPPRRAG
ncbi:MAG: YihY/virulence factor BrkB family protein [Proteobacteria bacterium]|nr:YihY/virulence factor BrkB family protein [Pseudomonadota bacterium]